MPSSLTQLPLFIFRAAGYFYCTVTMPFQVTMGVVCVIVLVNDSKPLLGEAYNYYSYKSTSIFMFLEGKISWGSDMVTRVAGVMHSIAMNFFLCLYLLKFPNLPLHTLSVTVAPGADMTPRWSIIVVISNIVEIRSQMVYLGS